MSAEESWGFVDFDRRGRRARVALSEALVFYVTAHAGDRATIEAQLATIDRTAFRNEPPGLQDFLLREAHSLLGGTLTFRKGYEEAIRTDPAATY